MHMLVQNSTAADCSRHKFSCLPCFLVISIFPYLVSTVAAGPEQEGQVVCHAQQLAKVDAARARLRRQVAALHLRQHVLHRLLVVGGRLV